MTLLILGLNVLVKGKIEWDLTPGKKSLIKHLLKFRKKKNSSLLPFFQMFSRSRKFNTFSRIQDSA